MRDAQQARDLRQKNSKRKDPIFPGRYVPFTDDLEKGRADALSQKD